MKYIQSIIAILMLTVMVACNDTNGKGQDGNATNEPPKKYTSAAEAANAAKQDMLAAIENKVAFGIDAEKLRAANPGAPLMRYNLQWNALLKADSSANFGTMAESNPATIVPLINNNEIITVIGIKEDNGSYGIGSLGDKQISTELNTVAMATGKMTENIKIYELPNLNATIYEVTLDSAKNMYFTSYNNNSIRQGMEAARLLPMLRADAEVFEKTFGEQLKKGKLVR